MKKLMLSVAMLTLCGSFGFAAEEAGIPGLGATPVTAAEHTVVPPVVPQVDPSRPQYTPSNNQDVQDLINKAVTAINTCNEQREGKRNEFLGRADSSSVPRISGSPGSVY